eukprot:Gb_29131 [translate_table: standard]
MVLNCCIRRVVNPLCLCLASVWLCLTAADDGSGIDANPPRLSSSSSDNEVVQTSLSTQNEDYTNPPVANFEVFINRRGKDVKDSLASYIYYLLRFHGVRVFLDREELRTGEEFPAAITEAIQSSSVHIVILSPHYAESYWCLSELALMFKNRNATTIIPVFYNVTPGEVRWAKGAFAEPFDKHYRRYSREMVDEWRAALQEVSYISGLSLSDLKGRLPIAVIEEVLKRIKSELLTVAKFPVGLKEHVRVSYIEDIKGEAEKKGFLEVQRKLLHNLLHYDYQVSDLSQGQQIIRHRLSNIDALIVLDNIKDKKQLDDILSLEVLLPCSTIIVTSRNSNIFKRCNNFLKYEMSGLNLSQSKKLFCQHAFDSGVVCSPFENMVDKFVGICKGIPLALEVCGGELYGESYATWKYIVPYFLVMAQRSQHLTRVLETFHGDMQQIMDHVNVLVSRQIPSTESSYFGRGMGDSRYSHGVRSHFPRYVFDHELQHMGLEDLHSLYRECRDYFYGTEESVGQFGPHDYVDSTYDDEHGQSSFFDVTVDNAYREYEIPVGMQADVQRTILETSIMTTFERVGGVGPSIEFEEPSVDLASDFTQGCPSYTSHVLIGIDGHPVSSRRF